MSWEEYVKQAKISEEKFAKNLIDPVWANNYQNMKEHWDVQGMFKDRVYRFDVKGMKKKNRWDNNFQDDIAWVEGTNVRGEPGWVKGKADYIVFERNKYWLLVDRQELFDHVVNKLQEKGYEKGKGVYKMLWNRRMDYINAHLSHYKLMAYCKPTTLDFYKKQGFIEKEIITLVEKTA